MATAEHSMWVFKRVWGVDVGTGFQMVSPANRALLLAADAASDTFDYRLTIDDTPAEPPEPPPEPMRATLRKTAAK